HDRGGFTNLDSRGAVMSLLEDGNSRMVVPFSKQAIEMMGMESWKDFKLMSSPVGLENIPTVHPIAHTTSYSFTIFPNIITPLGAAGFPFMHFFPDGPGRTNIRIYHYATPENINQTEEWATRLAGFAQIIDEDVENMDPMNRAMNSPLYTGVPISYQERRIWHMNEVIDQTIGVERIPEALRVAQLLGDRIEPTVAP
ncbi:MAG: RHO alpha subunit C-terminal catalytic domain-containing protein, partial [Microthrixaceae bacterium]